MSAAENFTHRDWLHVIKRGKRLYKNRFYETYHVNRVDAHRDCPTIAKQKQDLYQNKFPKTFGVPIPENWKKNKEIVIVIAMRHHCRRLGHQCRRCRRRRRLCHDCRRLGRHVHRHNRQ